MNEALRLMKMSKVVFGTLDISDIIEWRMLMIGKLTNAPG